MGLLSIIVSWLVNKPNVDTLASDFYYDSIYQLFLVILLCFDSWKHMFSLQLATFLSVSLFTEVKNGFNK